MIRQSAFTGTGRLLKGNLHCHTTRSDGDGIPAEVIALYEQNGYDFLSLTDHRVYNLVNHLPGSRLTIIPGMEMDYNIAPKHPIHCFHTVWIGPEAPQNPYGQDQRFEGGMVLADQQELQPHLDRAHADRQLTIYCHPQWSGTFVREFEQLQGNFALELWNSISAINHGCDTNNGFLWDELLMQGKRIYGVASDDGHEMRHHCHGWVRVNSRNTVADILAALENGAFYASTGPEIQDFYIDDEGVGHLRCSPCALIRFICGARIMHRLYDPAGALTEAKTEFSLPDYFPYLRAEVTDRDGRVAWTNPIFLK